MASKRVTQFDSATFLANAGLGRTIIELEPDQTFFARETRRTVCSICKEAVQRSLSSRRGAKKPQSPFYPLAILLERVRLRLCLGCDWLRPPPLPPAPRSR